MRQKAKSLTIYYIQRKIYRFHCVTSHEQEVSEKQEVYDVIPQGKSQCKNKTHALKVSYFEPAAPRITRCHITCLREKAGKASNSCLAKATFSRSISLAVCVTVYFWLIRSLVDPTSTSSIIVRGPLQFSRLLYCLNFFGVVSLNRSDMLCRLSMVLSMRFNVKMVLSIYNNIQLTLRDRNSMLCLLSS